MPEVRRRRVAATAKPVSRRRDRTEEPDDDEEEEDVDAVAEPVRARSTTKKAATRRRAAPVEDEEEEEEEEDEEEEPAPRARKATRTTKKAPARRRRPPADEDEEDEEEEEKPARRRSSKSKPPPGIHAGISGAQKVAEMGGAGNRLQLKKDPVLVKVLGITSEDTAPLASFAQHWIRGQAGGDRPETCAETNCPMCNIGDRASKTFAFNVLHFPVDAEPTNSILQMGIKAYNAFTATATPRGKDAPVFERNFWAISKSGKNQSSQTNFKPVKLADIKEDWQEIFENFDPEDLEDIIEEAEDNAFGIDIFDKPNRTKLKQLAKYAAAEEDDDEEDDDE